MVRNFCFHLSGRVIPLMVLTDVKWVREPDSLLKWHPLSHILKHWRWLRLRDLIELSFFFFFCSGGGLEHSRRASWCATAWPDINVWHDSCRGMRFLRGPCSLFLCSLCSLLHSPPSPISGAPAVHQSGSEAPSISQIHLCGDWITPQSFLPPPSTQPPQSQIHRLLHTHAFTSAHMTQIWCSASCGCIIWTSNLVKQTKKNLTADSERGFF